MTNNPYVSRFPPQWSVNPTGANAEGTNYKDNCVSVGCYSRFGEVHFSRWRQVDSVYFSPLSQKSASVNFVFLN